MSFTPLGILRAPSKADLAPSRTLRVFYTNTSLFFESRKYLQDLEEYLWPQTAGPSQMEAFKREISSLYKIPLLDYFDLHTWSINHLEDFWKQLALYFGLSSDSQKLNPVRLKQGQEPMLGWTWFPELRLNYTEYTFSRLPDAEDLILTAFEGCRFKDFPVSS